MIRLSDYPYTDITRDAMTRFLPEWDWLWLPAQLWQESSWNPSVTNKTSGAMGIAQFMPATWQDVAEELDFPTTASAYNPAYAIPAAAFYMGSLRKQWSHVPRSEDERRKLSQASYNAGLGNILRAQGVVQKAHGNFNDAMTILAALPQVTGQANAQETIDYVINTAKWFGQLSTNGETK